MLTLDGGGIRGLYSACVLNSISNRYSKDRAALDIGKGFDLIVGTSTGAILGAAIAFGIPLEKVIKLYLEGGPLIFKNPAPERGLKLAWWSFKNSMSAANRNVILKEYLSSFFGQTTLNDLWAKRKIGFCATAVNLSTHRARVFKTGHCKNKNLDDKRTLVDVCLASSAAPIILPIAKMTDPDNPQRIESFVDGGIWANNPVVLGLVEALECTTPEQPVEIISIGTCAPVTGKIISEEICDEGLSFWKAGILPLSASMDAQADGNFHTAKFLAANLTKIGKSCTIQRFHQSSPSAEQAKHLALDKTHKEALAALMDLAAEDAALINGKINNDEENYKIVHQIFNGLNALKNEV